MTEEEIYSEINDSFQDSWNGSFDNITIENVSEGIAKILHTKFNEQVKKALEGNHEPKLYADGYRKGLNEGIEKGTKSALKEVEKSLPSDENIFSDCGKLSLIESVKFYANKTQEAINKLKP